MRMSSDALASKNLMDKHQWETDHLMEDSTKAEFLINLQFLLIKVEIMLKMSETEVEKDFLLPTTRAQ